MVGRRVTLAFCLLFLPGLSGCLADDVWREPFAWREMDPVGARVDAAQAMAGALQGLGDRGSGTGQEVVDTVDDVPDNVVFQNMRDFLNQQSPGRGDQVHDNVTTATGSARGQYVNLTGPAAAAYRNATTDLNGTGGSFPFPVAQRATRVGLAIDVVLTRPPPEEGVVPAPAGNVAIRVTDPRGAVRFDHVFESTQHRDDLFIEGTYGGDNEVREHLGGVWRVDVEASGEGAWAVALDAYEPVYDDYAWYQFWRAEPREVAGE